jgi:hypothetical protein
MRKPLLALTLILAPWLVTLASATPLAAQQPADLERIASEVARAWAEGNPERLVALLSSEGIRLRIEGMERSSLSSRQAQALFRELFRIQSPAEARVVRAAPVAGYGDRGYAELRWVRSVGENSVLVHSVFVGFVRMDGVWRVDELRILP